MDKHLMKGGKQVSDSDSTALPGQTLATSKIPRMLTPSEIELLKQDLKMALAAPTGVRVFNPFGDVKQLILKYVARGSMSCHLQQALRKTMGSTDLME